MVVIFLVGLSYLIKAIGSILMIGIIFFGYCLLESLQQGVFSLTLSESLKLFASAIFLFWVSLRLMMFGEKLSRKS